MIKLKQIKEQTEFAAQIAKSKAKMDAIMAQQQKLTDKSIGNFRGGDFKPLANLQDPRTQTSKSNTDKTQVKKIFDNSRNLPSSVQDWEQIKPIAEAMHTALSGLGAGDFLDQLKKIRTQTQLSALIKNWMYDGQTLFQWLEAEYTISWKQILDVIKSIQTIVGKYSSGIFDNMYNSFKSAGWKLEVANNSLDSSYMYYGLWIIRRDSPIITYGNSKTGQIKFNSNLDELRKTKFYQTTSVISLNDIILRLKRSYSYGKEFNLSFSYDLKTCIDVFNQSKTFYINFLPIGYKQIVYKYYETMLLPIFADAKQWWIDKIDDPQFTKIFQRVNSVDMFNANKIINKYKTIINHIKIYIECQYYEKTPIAVGGYYHPATGTITMMIDRVIATAWVFPTPDDFKQQFNNSLKEEIFSTTIHELQHSLWDYQPLNPKVKWEAIQPYDNNTGNIGDRLWYTVFGKNIQSTSVSEKQINTLSKRYKIPVDIFNQWIAEAKKPNEATGVIDKLKNATMNFYACDINEHQSRLTQFKRALNLNTADPVSVQHMITAIKLAPYYIQSDSQYEYWYYILICWTRNGMLDPQRFISWLNSELIVKQDINKSRKDNRTDFTKTA